MSGILVIISVFHSSSAVVELVCPRRPRTPTVGEHRSTRTRVLLKRVEDRVGIECLRGIPIV